MKTSERSSARAASIVAAYRELHSDVFENDESAIGDLLTDVCHLCDTLGVEWQDRVRFAEECHAEEVDDDHRQ